MFIRFSIQSVVFVLTVSFYFGARVFDIQAVGIIVHGWRLGWQGTCEWPTVHEHFVGFCYTEVCRHFNSTPRTYHRYISPR